MTREATVDLEIRRMEPTERDEVRDLHEACFDEDVAFDDMVLDRVFRHANAINLVAVRDDTIVGYAAGLHGSRPKARLLTIQTHPEARGQGVAGALLADLEDRVRARRAELLELEVHVDNEPAIQLYEKHGFQLHREDATAYPSLANTTGYILRKPL